MGHNGALDDGGLYTLNDNRKHHGFGALLEGLSKFVKALFFSDEVVTTVYMSH